MSRLSALLAVVAFAACGGQQEPAATPPLPPAEEPGAKPMSPEDCQAQSGEVLHDQGCPSGRTQLGMVGPGGEGGVCCSAPGGGAPVEQPTGKRSPCTLGADQTCN